MDIVIVLLISPPYELLMCCSPPEGEEVVEVAVEMSLDEWKNLQKQSRPKNEFNIRKAETAVPTKATVIHKSKLLEVMVLYTLLNG